MFVHRPQSSVSSTQDLPGFRKILPRASYIFLPKGSPSSHQAEPGPLAETLGPPVVDGNPSSASLPQETQCPALALDSAVEFAEQCVIIEGVAEETMASVSEPTTTTTTSATTTAATTSDVQGVLTPGSTSCPAFLSKSPATASPHDPPVLPVACASSCGMLLAASDPGVVSGNSVYSVVKLKPDDAGMLQPMKQEMSQVVTIIPAQVTPTFVPLGINQAGFMAFKQTNCCFLTRKCPIWDLKKGTVSREFRPSFPKL